MAAAWVVPMSQAGSGKLKQYEGHLTLYLILACLAAASGGLIYGYDIGISGGVTSMENFLEKFYPKVYRNVRAKKSNNYCRYNSQTLQLFSSSMYIAGVVATFLSSYVSRHYGRKPTMLVGALSCCCGAILDGAAQNLTMLIVGRALVGVSVGFTNQAVPVYLSEVAPANWRGILNILFQSAITVSYLAANLINYVTGKVHPNGWRISLGLATVPGIILTIGVIFLPDSPSSLLERGHTQQGRQVLEKLRGATNVDAEFEDLLEASNKSSSVKSPWKNLLERQYRPQLVMALFIPAFNQLGGNNAVVFYAPVLFRSIGFGSKAALYSAVIIGTAKVVSTWLSMLIVDRWGRKILLLEGGVQMAACQIALGVMFTLKLGAHNSLDHALGAVVIVLMCAFVAAYEWSWGPLGWLVPSEIFPLEIRPAAQSIAVSAGFLFNLLMTHDFLTMSCHLKANTYFLFTGLLVIMTTFVALLLPETKNIPIEKMARVWSRHWLWKRFVDSNQDIPEHYLFANLNPL